MGVRVPTAAWPEAIDAIVLWYHTLTFRPKLALSRFYRITKLMVNVVADAGFAYSERVIGIGTFKQAKNTNIIFVIMIYEIGVLSAQSPIFVFLSVPSTIHIFMI